MTLRHLTIFRELCTNQCNSTVTAQRLHMTQPAVSLAIKELEQHYGVRLFDRIGRRLQLTEAGRHFLEYAIHICSLFDEMELQIRDWDQKGVLRIGASITIGSQFMPEYVKTFSEMVPTTEIYVTVDQSETLEHKILSNDLDLALIEGIPHHPSIAAQIYMEDHLQVICPPNAVWEQEDIISQEEFKRQKFLLRETGSGTREVFDRTIQNAGFSIEPLWESVSTTALINAVRNGLGISVLPAKRVQELLSNGALKTVFVEGLAFNRYFYLIHHKDKYLTGSARKFISLITGRS